MSVTFKPAVRRNRGDGTIHDGYLRVFVDGKLVRMQTIVAERAIGKKLPLGAIVHHVDNDKLNNENWNLVICPSDAYHAIMHMRTRAYDATGNANMRKCLYCKQYDLPENMRLNKHSRSIFHPACDREYQKNRRVANGIPS